jgi:hypothetical protein
MKDWISGCAGMNSQGWKGLFQQPVKNRFSVPFDKRRKVT